MSHNELQLAVLLVQIPFGLLGMRLGLALDSWRESLKVLPEEDDGKV